MAGFEGTKVKTLDDLVRFNLDHAAIELPPGMSPVPPTAQEKQGIMFNSDTL